MALPNYGIAASTNVFKPQTSTNPYQAMASELGGSAAAAIAQNNVSAANTKAAGLNQGNTISSEAQALQQQSGISLGQNTLAGQNIGLEQQGNTLAKQLATYLQNISTQQYGLTQQQLGEQGAENTYGYKTNTASQQATNAGTGVADSPGNKQAMATLAKNYGWSQADVKRQQQQAKLGYQSSTAQYQTGQAQSAIQTQTLNNLAKSNGMSADQIKDSLTTGLTQYGLEGATNADQVLAALANAKATNDTTIMDAIAPVLTASGLNLGNQNSGTTTTKKKK